MFQLSPCAAPRLLRPCLPADPVYTSVGVFKSDRVTIQGVKITADRGIQNTDGGLAAKSSEPGLCRVAWAVGFRTRHSKSGPSGCWPRLLREGAQGPWLQAQLAPLQAT